MTSRATAGAEARETLARALLALTDRGMRPRCSDSPQLWISENADERATAATWCAGCPILEACSAAGEFERFGIWAGQDRTDHPRAVAS